jgi:DNA-binding MarR family transcriptional regulator
MSKQHYTAETYQARGSVAYLIKRAQSLLIDRLEQTVAPGDLTPTQWVILMYLRDGLAINASDLCTQLRHDSGALTRVLDQLESRGLVIRERSREDRRAVELRLTDAGRDVLETYVPRVVDALNDALGDFSKAEMTELLRLLSKLISRLDGSTSSAGSGSGGASGRPEVL